jgi:hypothetical protein
VRWGRREVAQTMYTHVSKCKNYKIKERKKKKRGSKFHDIKYISQRVFEYFSHIYRSKKKKNAVCPHQGKDKIYSTC